MSLSTTLILTLTRAIFGDSSIVTRRFLKLPTFTRTRCTVCSLVLSDLFFSSLVCSEMFTIGYLLNETPGPIRFLLSLSLDPIVSATGDVAVLSLPASGNLYAILDVVKAYFEQNVFSAPIPDIHGIFIERPSGERLFQLQFLVRDKAAVKGDLMKLLGKFESLSAAGIEERIEDFSRFVNIFDSRPSSSLSSIFDTRPSLSHSKLQLSRLKEQQIQAHEPDTESTELVCSSSRLGSSFVRPPRVRRVPLSDSDFCQRRASRRHILPPLAIPTSTSNDLTVEDFPEPLTPRPLPNTLSPDGSPDAAKIHPAAPKKKQAGTAAKVSEFGSDSWLRMGHSNPHLGRKAFARLRDAMSVDSSSSDSSDNF